jgi:hypothetical protein
MDPRILYSLQSAVLFFILAAPFAFAAVQAIFGRLFAVTRDGRPTYAGVALHALVYGLVVYVLMIVQTKKEPSKAK